MRAGVVVVPSARYSGRTFHEKRPVRTGMLSDVKPSVPASRSSPGPAAKSACMRMKGTSEELKKRGSQVTDEFVSHLISGESVGM